MSTLKQKHYGILEVKQDPVGDIAEITNEQKESFEIIQIEIENIPWVIEQLKQFVK